MLSDMFTAITMFAASLRPFTWASAARGKKILLSALVGFMMGPGNSASDTLSSAV